MSTVGERPVAPTFDVTESTAEPFESRGRSGHRRRRGWVMRRALLAADLLGLTIAFVLAALVTGRRNDYGADSLSAFGEAVVFLSASLSG